MELKARKAALFAQVVDGDALMAGADRRRRRPRPVRRLTAPAVSRGSAARGTPRSPGPPRRAPPGRGAAADRRRRAPSRRGSRGCWPCESSERSDWLESTDSTDIDDPTEAAERNEPRLADEPNEQELPIDSTELSDAIESTDPVHPMDSSERRDHSDQREVSSGEEDQVTPAFCPRAAGQSSRTTVIPADGGRLAWRRARHPASSSPITRPPAGRGRSAPEATSSSSAG